MSASFHCVEACCCCRLSGQRLSATRIICIPVSSGCIRLQIRDEGLIDELCKKVTSWMYSHPGERIRYERFKTR
ncbi:hypothetical protein FC325_18180 [Escherichia coli]|nr:hypothetical protein [Escherichia coli]EFN4327309.1 hypothetical protein [Escherichia coli]MBF8852329.1 hypothetical protein [Escherichia coli]QLE22949.1 hypothetical protein FC325_18180 [Escherichia coli]